LIEAILQEKNRLFLLVTKGKAEEDERDFLKGKIRIPYLLRSSSLEMRWMMGF